MCGFKRICLLVVAGLICSQFFAKGQFCTSMEAGARERKILRFDTTASAGLADNNYLWNVGATIHVRFINGNGEQHAQVMALAKEWEQYANIKFVQTKSEPSQIRVEFSDRKENYSFLGTDAHQAEPEENTLHFELGLFDEPTRLKRIVLHEFGHVLGFMHEHSIPDSGIKWNKDTIYKEYAKFGWDKDIVDEQLFSVYERPYTNGLKYDKNSIMCFPIHHWQTTNGHSVDWNAEISEGDKELTGLIYPFTGLQTNEAPNINIINYTTTRIKPDKTSGGINLYPSFNIETSGAISDVFLSIMIFDKNGNSIKPYDEKYNICGVVGAYKMLRMGPGFKLFVNKGKAEEFALFIPYSSIPNTPNNSEILIVFRAFVDDRGIKRSIFFSNPISYLMDTK
jgi:hypothetical protein